MMTLPAPRAGSVFSIRRDEVFRRVRSWDLRPTASLLLFGAFASGMSSGPALAKDEPEPRRTRLALGPRLVPSYPGSSEYNFRPFIEVFRTRGDTPFEFQAGDESIGFSVIKKNGLAVGPSLAFEGSRTARDVGTGLPRVGSTVEVGAFVQYQASPDIRLRAEGRKGLGGHRGWLGNLSADYVVRQGDDNLFSIGPRVTLSDGRYHHAFFGVAPDDAAASGLRTFRSNGGVHAVGAAATVLRQFNSRWGFYGYARYDRLVRNAGRSPIVRAFGSRNQFSGGAALTYTFASGSEKAVAARNAPVRR